MTGLKRKAKLATVCGLILAMATGISAQEKPEKKESQPSISVMDSTEAQWGRRSINDSIYRGYTVNAVYFERGRQKLPDSFKMYKPKPIGADNIVRSENSSETPTTIKVNGKNQKLPTE